MTLRSQRVLVTGSGGFIGSHLLERLLSEGAQVRAFLHYNSRGDLGMLEHLSPDALTEIEVFWGDLRDADVVRRSVRGIDGIFHLGALVGIPYSYHTPEAYVATNIGGTLNLLTASLDEPIRFFVHTSTSEVYGTAQRVPIDESHPLHAQSPYAATKIAADQLALSFHLSYGLPVATIRPFNNFGPRQSPRAVIPTIVGQALNGQTIRLGSLDTIRDFTYVLDTVEAFVRIATEETAVGQIINIGTGRGVSIVELATLVTQLTGSEAEVVKDERRLRPERSEVFRLICDGARAKDVLGWEPAWTLEKGLLSVIEFMGANSKRHYQEEAYAI